MRGFSDSSKSTCPSAKAVEAPARLSELMAVSGGAPSRGFPRDTARARRSSATSARLRLGCLGEGNLHF